jgi:hypothetical protein
MKMKATLFNRGQAENEKIETIIKMFKLDEVKEAPDKKGLLSE